MLNHEESKTDDLDYEEFKININKLMGLDLNAYKQKQMYRRLNSLIKRLGMSNYKEYFNLIKENKEQLEYFKNYVTINVTEFFRNPAKFEELQTIILPKLIKNSPNGLKIWSAGCSLGAEAYTLSIIMHEFFPKIPYKIYATDIDEDILNKAKKGIYGPNELKNIDEKMLRRYFTSVEGLEKIRDNIKESVIFKKNNLLKDSFEIGYDLILCRNVVIYFTEQAKDILYRKFFNSLKTNGVLFVGGTENILNAKEIGFSSPKTFFYEKTTY